MRKCASLSLAGLCWFKTGGSRLTFNAQPGNRSRSDALMLKFVLSLTGSFWRAELSPVCALRVNMSNRLSYHVLSRPLRVV